MVFTPFVTGGALGEVKHGVCWFFPSFFDGPTRKGEFWMIKKLSMYIRVLYILDKGGRFCHKPWQHFCKRRHVYSESCRNSLDFQ